MAINKMYEYTCNFENNFQNIKKLLPSIFASGVTQINILVGTVIASFQASAVSYLYYADRIYQINLAIAGIAIGVVVLPQLSKHIHLKRKKPGPGACISNCWYQFLDLKQCVELFRAAPVVHSE